MMRARVSRLSLLWKILLSTSVAVTLLFALTGEIVIRETTETMSGSLQEEVRSSFQAYNSLWNARANLLSSVSRVISGMSDVRALLSTRDEATIRDSAGELWSKISDSSALFLVADPRGKVIASLGGGTDSSLLRNTAIVATAQAHFPEQVSGFYLEGGNSPALYQLSLTPVYVQSARTQYQELLDVLVAGYRVDALVALKLKEATGSEFLFLARGRAIASTLNDQATGVVTESIARAHGPDLVTDGTMKYAWSGQPLLDIAGKPVGQICILRSFEAAQRRIAGLYTNIIGLWVGAIFAGLGLSYLLARRIVKPVQQLDLAAAEVARQNYAIEVEVSSEDELGRLARTFNTMCASIRQARENLIQQERISTIGRLSASIVHDLRNPLAAIYGGAEMLVDGDLPSPRIKRLASNIYGASRRIQGLLQDLLDVSRAKTSQPEPCRLRDVAAAACDSLATTAEAQQVTVINSIPAEIELPLEPNRMERAFVNLIGNSLEAMAEGGNGRGVVRISATLDGGSVVVQVEDNGPGIAPEIRSKLFQPFVTAGKRNGLGLGLALTRQTVMEHGGEMWVESEPGRGARIGFRLPGARLVRSETALRV
jgi:signal transduction histidine kinase